MLVAAINNRLITIVCYGLWAALFAAMVAYFMLPFRFHIAGTIGFVSGAAAWMITGAGVENRSYARIFAKGALVSLIFGFSAPFLVADLPNWQSINSEVLGLYILGGMVLTAVGIPFAFLGTVLFVRVIPMRLAAATAVLWLLVFGAYHFGYRTGLMGLGWPGAFREAIFAGLTHEPPHEIKFAEVFPFDWDEVSFEWGDSFYMWTPRKTLTFGGVTPELASGGLPCRPFGPVFRFLMSVSGVSERVFLYPGALRALSQTRRFIL